MRGCPLKISPQTWNFVNEPFKFYMTKESKANDAKIIE